MRIRHSLIVLMTAVLFAAGCGSQEPGAVEAVVNQPPPISSSDEVLLDVSAQRDTGVEVEEVEVRSLSEVLQATGRMTINENRTWRIGAVTQGRVVKIFANVGDRVEKGQTLARMYSHDIHEAHAQYQKAVAELDRLKSSLAYARAVRDRTRRLYDLKAAPLQQVEQAQAEMQNAETAVAHGQVELERTQSHLVDFLKVPLAEVEGHDIRGTSESGLIPVNSPASGTLLQRNVTPGTVVEASGELFVITDLSTLWMIAAVNEEDHSKLRSGLPVNVFVQAYPDRPFAGRINKVGEELDPTTRTIMARVTVPNATGLLKPEMYATAELELGGSRRAIFVPQGAIQEVKGHTAVFVRVAEDRFEARAVEFGRAVGGSQEITSGLEAGDQ
ncbi:MAG: efflux RND transporter periplasmic adaptor subunit, partial [bacterium]|nr:efflux RND transporter periplasmic adaptor subunit [bacterium]